MCYDITLMSPRASQLEERFHASFQHSEKYSPIYHVSAFSLPKIPVITNDAPQEIQLFTWGLVPFWVKDTQQMEDIRLKTMNARGETLTEKPAFRHAAIQKHCLVLADGFFEWREYNGRKYPYYLRLRSHEPFTFAGLWDSWHNKQTEEQLNTFTIITTRASPLLAQVHNTKKRMPVLLPKNKEQEWLQKNQTKEHLAELLIPVKDSELEAYPISRLITSRTQDSNVPEVLQPYSYQELPPLSDQTTLL